MPKHYVEKYVPPDCPNRESMGSAPALLAKRSHVKPRTWCPKDLEYDPWCDPDNPKTILPRDVYKAAAEIGDDLPVTPLIKSKHTFELGYQVYYKLECFNRCHSASERGAHYILKKLPHEQAQDGVYTASTGEWGKALALKARQFKVPLTVVLPIGVSNEVCDQIRAWGATAIKYGRNLAEAKRQAFILKNENGCGTYLNGYDHPHSIAASGIIGKEILEQLPETDAILIPVGGGGLIAGISTLVKQRKPEVLIYGIEPDQCCSFFKAMENERPYKTECAFSIADSLAVPLVGYNAYHTAISLIDKMVLTEDDWIPRAILHLAETEKMVVDGTGGITLSALLTKPDRLPELEGKKIVCVITCSNIENYRLSHSLQRALVIEGRLIYFTVKVRVEDMKKKLLLFNVIANLGVNINYMETEKMTFASETDIESVYINLECETRDLLHACSLKRILTRLFPGACQFREGPFSPIPICVCSPKRRLM